MNYPRLLSVSWVLVLALGCFFVVQPAQAQELTDEQIGEGIEKIKRFLLDAQDQETSAWFGAYHRNLDDAGVHGSKWGPSAIALYALIAAGESPQHPDIARGLEALSSADVTGTYPMVMRIHVWSHLPDFYLKQLQQDTKALQDSMYGTSEYDGGVFIRYHTTLSPEYGQVREGARDGYWDTHVMLYSALAMWEASKRGYKIPNSYWEQVVDVFLRTQDASGGWKYAFSPPYDNLAVEQTRTLAGLTCLYLGQQALFRGDSNPNETITKAIDRALGYLDRSFDPDVAVHAGRSNMWYGYERVGLASGVTMFGGQDWFRSIAQRILDRNAEYDDSIHQAAFDLLFLSRGRVPVWVNKLEIPGVDWNNRPNDVYFLNQFISEYREHEVNWQVVRIDSDPKDWVRAPLMWLSSDGGIEWTDGQVAKIKEYLDLGGTLLANGEKRSGKFRSSIKELAERLYPELEFEPMTRDHPMATLLEGSARGNRAPNVEILSNGARVLMILPKDDWGLTFQKDLEPDPNKTPAWRDIVNIYGVVTDRGELTPRLASPLVQRVDRADTGTIKVVIPTLSDPAGKVHETDVYRVMKDFVHNETGRRLDVKTLPLSEVASADPALLHLMGVNAVELTDDERDAIKAFADSGGTILIENLGGTGEFATSVSDQLQQFFGGVDDGVSTRSNIITGRNLPEGAKNIRNSKDNPDRFYYRSLVVQQANPDGRLLLRGWSEGRRVPVVLSYQDISMGMLGVKQYGINGYSIPTSRNLMLNILLDAEQAKNGG